MKTLVRTVPYDSRSDVFHLYPTPDVHLGNSACDEKALAEWVSTVAADPHAYWIGMGDYAEFINRKDKRFDEESIAPWLYGVGDLAKAQRDRAIATFAPIADKCLALVKGNHEETIYQHTERDVYGPMVEALGKTGQPLGMDYLGFVRVAFQRAAVGGQKPHCWACDIFVTHGWWAGRLHGNGSLNLERLGGWVQAQLVLAGHDHKLKTQCQVVVKPCKGGGVEKMRQVCGSVGAFLDGARYAERSGYRPSPTGWLTVTIEPDRHEIRIMQ